jgi:hypothetical protein
MTLTLPELYTLDEALTVKAGHSYNWYEHQDLSELRSRVRAEIESILSYA